MYHILSLSKIIIGLTILLSLYMTINPYSDPLIALGGGMIGVFIMGRGLSFYLFYGWKKFISHQPETPKLLMESYKTSLLFGLYLVLNAILLLRHQRTALIGLIILIVFIVLQSRIVPEHSDHHLHPTK